MEDTQIVQLFLDRKEAAIEELDRKYNRYCFQIAWNILNSREDSEECVNDTWFRTWNYIPPNNPAILSSGLGRTTRGRPIARLRRKYAAKRVDMHMADVEAETAKLDDLIVNTVDDRISEREFYEILNGFLWQLAESERDIFLRRYWHMDSIKEISARHGRTEGSVKNSLYRTRKKLYKLLEKEGVPV